MTGNYILYIYNDIDMLQMNCESNTKIGVHMVPSLFTLANFAKVNKLGTKWHILRNTWVD